jgi:threonyl-tRNA synthetase
MQDASLKLYKWEDAEGKHAFWHTSSHLMAEAIETLFPGTKFGIGPAIENGFYYDIDLGERVLTRAHLSEIEKKMTELARAGAPMQRREVSKSEALEFFTNKGDEYKLELIRDLQDGTISFYQLGTFTRPLPRATFASVAPIKAVKLLSIAGAYWRGDETRKQLTRVYGITFPKQKCLRNTCRCWKKPNKEITANWARSWNCLCSRKESAQGYPCGCPEAPASQPARELPQEGSGRIRVRSGHDPPHRAQGTVGNLRPLCQIRQGLLPAIHTPQEAKSSCSNP